MNRPPVRNRLQLEKLLLTTTSKESIYDVIGRMEVLLDYFNQNNLSGFIPFLKTYYFVTKAAAEKYLFYRHFFWSLSDYQRLDIYFASLYFKPMYEFLNHGTAHRPWQAYFDYCQKPDGFAFIQMVLGINAHINADLYHALLKLKYRNKHDFFLVNRILEEVALPVIHFLASEHDLIGLGGLTFQDFIYSEFREIILRWRKEAWENSLKSKTLLKPLYYDQVLLETERVGRVLIENFSQIYHFQNLPGNIKSVNSLKVKI